MTKRTRRSESEPVIDSDSEDDISITSDSDSEDEHICEVCDRMAEERAEERETCASFMFEDLPRRLLSVAMFTTVYAGVLMLIPLVLGIKRDGRFILPQGRAASSTDLSLPYIKYDDQIRS